MKIRGSKNGVLFLVAVLAFSFVALSGCSKKSTVSSVPYPFGDEKLAELKIQADDWAFIAREKGWLKETFEQHGIKVTLVQGTTGNEVQLFSRGDLHIASRMLYPYLLYRTQGADFMAISVSKHPEPEIASVMVLADSPYKTFDDLKGKKIASWRAGCPYLVLFELAEQRNWVLGKDWTYVNIPTNENKNALLSKEIDAASGHLITNDLAPMLVNGITREIAYPERDSIYINGGGVTVIFSNAEFARKYPNIIKAYIALRRSSEAWILANFDEAGAIIEGITRVPPDVSKLYWQRHGSTWESSKLNLATIQKETKALQDWMVEHGDIAADKQVDMAALFDPQYFLK